MDDYGSPTGHAQGGVPSGAAGSGRGGRYSLGVPAEEMYSHLARHRQTVIDVGRDMAQITIPSVLPPDGYRTGDNINVNNQSVGALCVNTLASKLMFMALSPFRPVLRFQVIEHKLHREIEQDPGMWDMVQTALGQVEIEHRNRLEATTIRSAYVGAVKLLIIGGNVLWEHLDIDRPIYHAPTHYVVKRNARGEPLITILRREVDVMDLDEDIQETIHRKMPQLSGVKDYQKRVNIEVVCRLQRNDNGDKFWEYWEEFQGERIDGTEFDAPFEEPPLYPAWMIPVYGQDWGRSYCEEYRGDLLKVENLASALNDGAAAASLLWLFLTPGARTSLRQLKKAENMALMSGRGEDVTAFKLDKGSDFQFVANDQEKAIQRLGRSFLLVSSVQRDAERVTAEEWGRMAQEIDEAMGGLYSELGQTFQTHVVRRFVALHNDEDAELPKLPKGIFRVAVVSAIDTMGRALEGQALVRAVGTVLQLFKEEGGKYISVRSFIARILSSEAIKQTGLLRTEEEVAGEMQQMQQQAMQQEMLSKAAGPVAGGIAKAAPEMLAMAAQQQQQQAGGEGEADGAPPSPQDFDAASPPPPA